MPKELAGRPIALLGGAKGALVVLAIATGLKGVGRESFLASPKCAARSARVVLGVLFAGRDDEADLVDRREEPATGLDGGGIIFESATILEFRTGWRTRGPGVDTGNPNLLPGRGSEDDFSAAIGACAKVIRILPI